MNRIKLIFLLSILMGLPHTAFARDPQFLALRFKDFDLKLEALISNEDTDDDIKGALKILFEEFIDNPDIEGDPFACLTQFIHKLNSKGKGSEKRLYDCAQAILPSCIEDGVKKVSNDLQNQNSVAILNGLILLEDDNNNKVKILKPNVSHTFYVIDSLCKLLVNEQDENARAAIGQWLFERRYISTEKEQITLSFIDLIYRIAEKYNKEAVVKVLRALFTGVTGYKLVLVNDLAYPTLHTLTATRIIFEGITDFDPNVITELFKTMIISALPQDPHIVRDQYIPFIELCLKYNPNCVTATFDSNDSAKPISLIIYLLDNEGQSDVHFLKYFAEKYPELSAINPEIKQSCEQQIKEGIEWATDAEDTETIQLINDAYNTGTKKQLAKQQALDKIKLEEELRAKQFEEGLADAKRAQQEALQKRNELKQKEIEDAQQKEAQTKALAEKTAQEKASKEDYEFKTKLGIASVAVVFAGTMAIYMYRRIQHNKLIDEAVAAIKELRKKLGVDATRTYNDYLVEKQKIIADLGLLKHIEEIDNKLQANEAISVPS